MPHSFDRSLHRLDSDAPRLSLLALIVIALFLGAWGAWFVFSRVAVYAVTKSARLEVDDEKHPVGAPVGGRTIRVNLAVGQVVRAGELLVELDATAERLGQREEQVRLGPAESQINLLKEELLAEERALAEERRGAVSARAEADAQARQALTAARFAADEARRLAMLHGHGLVSELEALRAKNEADAREGDARTASLAAERLGQDLEVREQTHLARIARLKRELAVAEGTRDEAAAASDRIGYEIQQRAIRAPIDGVVAEISPIRVGSVIEPGDRICTIVPAGDVKVVAFFPPSVAVGRVHPGQPARVRLDAFPWMQYGTAAARVSTVASELHEGQIRVELSLDRTASSNLPLQHGLPAEVNIEVEQVSPATLMLRSISAYASVAAMER